jgi:DNA-binding LacI/PurR family transcriptional regulator
MFDLGQKAAQALLKKLDNSELYIQTYTALPHLIIRESTAHHT